MFGPMIITCRANEINHSMIESSSKLIKGPMHKPTDSFDPIRGLAVGLVRRYRLIHFERKGPSRSEFPPPFS